MKKVMVLALFQVPSVDEEALDDVLSTTDPSLEENSASLSSRIGDRRKSHPLRHGLLII